MALNKIKLPSGVELGVDLAPWEVSWELNEAVIAALKDVKLDPKADIIDVNFRKDLFVVVLTSRRVKDALWACLPSCTYGGPKITRDSFESERGREDYLDVCYEVGKANILPFMKNLYAKFSAAFQGIPDKSPA